MAVDDTFDEEILKPGQTMPAVTRDQFEVKENEVVHIPTGATFGADPDDKILKNINSGLAGGMPLAHKDYHLKDIERVAKQLLAERLQRRD